jgi:hypothetical protein
MSPPHHLLCPTNSTNQREERRTSIAQQTPHSCRHHPSFPPRDAPSRRWWYLLGPVRARCRSLWRCLTRRWRRRRSRRASSLWVGRVSELQGGSTEESEKQGGEVITFDGKVFELVILFEGGGGGGGIGRWVLGCGCHGWNDERGDGRAGDYLRGVVGGVDWGDA